MHPGEGQPIGLHVSRSTLRSSSQTKVGTTGIPLFSCRIMRLVINRLMRSLKTSRRIMRLVSRRIMRRNLIHSKRLSRRPGP